MTIKTLFIAPYPAMIPLIEECQQEEQDLDIHIELGNLQEAIPVAKEGERQGYDVIISRGGTAKLIEAEVGIPVIDVHVSGYDMLRVLTLANDFPGKKAIVGFSNITLGAKAITDVLDIGVEVFTIEKAQEVDELVKYLKMNGYELIMGDVVTIEAAARYSLEGILIQSGREAIFEAFMKVKSTYRLYQSKQQEISLLHALLQETASNFVVLGPQGQVVYEHWTDFAACPVPVSELRGGGLQDSETQGATEIREVPQGKLKQKRVRKVVRGQVYDLYTFSELRERAGLSGERIEAVSQLPMIVAKSPSMSETLDGIARHLSSTCLVLIGEAGTGKRLLSQYIHYKKHAGEGLYAHLTARHVLDAMDAVDPDVRTVYINGLDELSPEDISRLVSVLGAQHDPHRTYVLALEQETPAYRPLLFDERSVRVHIPSLQERKEDIRPLATYYIAAFHGTLGTSPIKIKEEALALLEAYHWPGNVDELKALLKDAVTGEKGYVIGKAKIAGLLAKKPAQAEVPESREFLQGTLDEIEKRIIHAIMKEENDNQTRVAERLGINRSTLWRKLKQ